MSVCSITNDQLIKVVSKAEAEVSTMMTRLSSTKWETKKIRNYLEITVLTHYHSKYLQREMLSGNNHITVMKALAL